VLCVHTRGVSAVRGSGLEGSTVYTYIHVYVSIGVCKYAYTCIPHPCIFTQMHTFHKCQSDFTAVRVYFLWWSFTLSACTLPLHHNLTHAREREERERTSFPTSCSHVHFTNGECVLCVYTYTALFSHIQKLHILHMWVLVRISVCSASAIPHLVHPCHDVSILMLLSNTNCVYSGTSTIRT
jgi:hypothetical protein